MDTQAPRSKFSDDNIYFRYYHGPRYMVFVMKSKQVFRIGHEKKKDLEGNLFPCVTEWEDMGTNWESAKQFVENLRSPEGFPMVYEISGRWVIDNLEGGYNDLDNKVIFLFHRDDENKGAHSMRFQEELIPDFRENILKDIFPEKNEVSVNGKRETTESTTEL